MWRRFHPNRFPVQGGQHGCLTSRESLHGTHVRLDRNRRPGSVLPIMKRALNRAVSIPRLTCQTAKFLVRRFLPA